ncbi:hypothetical protein M406DRAFT_45665 [Cryphonectria parasitica EP155]|uniref:Uncharacterized protein n=1 Tax=Cryphonectria parasitica (strain ATCC 38755 / EP155) TaxID=660469 RepID=A0A9P5CKZ1_CRYP1|nr:uncharacterized protein M406DRAFT_45665 [Cryphonectria parasitica EP155]KAF3762784.1 hypothetical protein M406DRAFT_45665 [Cryphonectria parasitica EP155]
MASLNCSSPPEKAATNAGVAGIGVILGFIVPATLSIVLAFSLIIQESFMHSKRPALGLIRRKLLFALSDQQIIYGIGIQAVGLAQITSLVPYHFFIIWMVSLLSTAVHNSTLLVLLCDFHSDRVLRWLRQVLMLVNLVLGCVFGICMLQVVQKGMTTSTNPTACAFVNGAPGDVQTESSRTLSFIGTIVVIGANFLVFIAATWFLQSRRQVAFKWIQLAGILLMAAIAVAATVRVLMSSQAFGYPSTPLADNAERAWSFSTSVTLLMLALPLMTVLEIWRGEVRVQREFEKVEG